MDAFVDINQIGVQDFDTPRTIVRKEQYPHLNSSYLGQSSIYTPMQHRKTNSELPANYYNSNPSQPSESKRNTNMKSITDKWLRSFSFSRNLTEDEQNAQLLANISHDEQQNQQTNLEDQTTLKKNYQTFDGGVNKSPLGIPFQPFAHTKTSFHARARDTNYNQNLQQQSLNHTSNFQANIDGDNLMKDAKQEQLSILNNDEGLRKYDEKIRDVSDTLAKLRAYKTQLTAIEQQQKFKQQTKRAKSSLSNFNITNNNSSDVSRRLPPIKQQPMMYFSPFEPPQGEQQSQFTKKRRSKKPKQAGITALAKNILSGLPQEKLANLMAVNMYNKALLKKEENEDKITTVISEQNKLLAKMLDQYDKRVHDTRKQIKLNVSRLQSDNIQELKFERDKRNFEKVYSEAQQKFTRECSSLERMPFNNINDISRDEANTKQLRYIPSHYKKYKSILETKVQQPPMIF